MSTKDKLLQAMKNNKKNVSKHQVLSLAEYHNCIVREGKGSHFIVTHMCVAYSLTIPNNKPIKSVYIKKFVKLIEEVILNEKNS